MLFVNQYSTKPAGNDENRNVNITGKNITLACIGSAGAGDNFVVRTLIIQQG